MWLFGLFDFLGFSVLWCPGFSRVVDFTISWFQDFDDYSCSAFFDFWTLGYCGIPVSGLEDMTIAGCSVNSSRRTRKSLRSIFGVAIGSGLQRWVGKKV